MEDFFSHGQGIDKSSYSSAAHTVLVNKNKRYLEEKAEAGRLVFFINLRDTEKWFRSVKSHSFLVRPFRCLEEVGF